MPGLTRNIILLIFCILISSCSSVDLSTRSKIDSNEQAEKKNRKRVLNAAGQKFNRI